MRNSKTESLVHPDRVGIDAGLNCKFIVGRVRGKSKFSGLLRLVGSPTPPCFVQRVRNRMKINELIFWRVQENARKSKRVRKMLKIKVITSRQVGTFAGLNVRPAGEGYTLRHPENSAKVSDSKGVVGWPLGGRACNRLKRKGLNQKAAEMEKVQEEKNEFDDRRTRAFITWRYTACQVISDISFESSRKLLKKQKLSD